jgi:hypothetical protein
MVLKNSGSRGPYVLETDKGSTKGDWVYLGHHPGKHFKLLTGAMEYNGTTIIDIDPYNMNEVGHYVARVN